MKRRNHHDTCQLCSRAIALTFHHLIPRKLHRRRRYAKQYTREQLNQGIMICQRCHSGLHRLYNETELGSRLNTVASLKADQAVIKHVNWVAKQQN